MNCQRIYFSSTLHIAVNQNLDYYFRNTFLQTRPTHLEMFVFSSEF